MENQFFNFKDTIKEFLKLDEEIRGLAKAKATRVKQRDKLSKDIMNYYKQNNIHSLDINNYDFKQQLALVESERHPSVNKKFLRTALANYCNNDKIVDKMIDYILDERTKNSKVSFKLKRIIPHNKKKNNTSSSSSSSTFDAMALVKENEKDKIKNRFAKLAEFAIIKDGIDPLNDIDTNNDTDISININNNNNQSNNNQSNNNIKIITKQPSTLEFTKHQSYQDNKKYEEEDKEDYDEEDELTEQEFKNIHEDYNENQEKNEDDDEDEVDLDNIPEENTGYSNEPPKVDIEIEKGNTIKNIICNKLDQMNQKEFIGSIPIPITKKEQSQPQKNQEQQYQEQQFLNKLEKEALASFNSLKIYSKTFPILLNWLAIQQEKLKIIKQKDQIKPEQYIYFMNNLNNKEKEIDNKYNFNNDINKLRSNIVNYIVSKNKIK
jgi:hypothetical protein